MFENSASAGLALALLFIGGTASATERLQAPPAGYVFRAPEPCDNEPVLAKRPPRPGQARYDVCADQMTALADGQDVARRTGRLLLVEIGATWCSWCAVLQRQLHEPDLRTHGVDVDKMFHIVPIGISMLHRGQLADVPSGRAVLDLVLAHTPIASARTTPFIVVIDPSDKTRIVARNLDDIALPSEGRFASPRLANVLKASHDHVRRGTPAPVEPGWFRRKLMRWWNS